MLLVARGLGVLCALPQLTHEHLPRAWVLNAALTSAGLHGRTAASHWGLRRSVAPSQVSAQRQRSHVRGELAPGGWGGELWHHQHGAFSQDGAPLVSSDTQWYL